MMTILERTIMSDDETITAPTEAPEDDFPENIRDEIRRAANTMKASAWRLAGLLHRAKQDDLYLDWGYDKWDDYLEAEVQVGKRAVNQLISNYRIYCEKLNISTEALKELDWTKARDMQKIVNAENVEELIDLAKTTPRRELIEHVRNRLSDDVGPEDAPVPVKKFVTLKFDADQYETYSIALQKAMEMAQTEVESYAIDLICQSFLQTHHDRAFTLEHWLKRIGKLFKTEILAVERSASANTKLEMMESFVRQVAKQEGFDALLEFFEEDMTANKIVDKLTQLVDKLVEDKGGNFGP